MGNSLSPNRMPPNVTPAQWPIISEVVRADVAFAKESLSLSLLLSWSSSSSSCSSDCTPQQPNKRFKATILILTMDFVSFIFVICRFQFVNGRFVLFWGSLVGPMKAPNRLEHLHSYSFELLYKLNIVQSLT